MASLLVQYTGGSGQSAAAVKQLLSRLRCSWRRRAARPRRSAVSFAYDLHSATPRTSTTAWPSQPESEVLFCTRSSESEATAAASVYGSSLMRD
ncbi:unnamed protein product [Miscanthus lutarioriparius]|uniref:Uncharacterized protein n=1 Tax=Miscanthus lutarioriparius TaxID=422564 RepID=A0A811SJJ8_9POAL|nr:unnamed protein product [Miscanthus lutarioriparius]